MDSIEDFFVKQPPTAARPLLGQTVLVVEDSRYACEALRLLCLRSGARIRRADTLAAARKHLRVYRPTVIIVDLGLPDGSGVDLIAELVGADQRPTVILASSGDEAGEAAAMDAGADGFLAKPLASVAQFQAAILAHLPRDMQPPGPRAVTSDAVTPDAIAYRDDLSHALDALTSGASDAARYSAQFVEGLARSMADRELARAAKALRHAPEELIHRARLTSLIQARAGSRAAV
ncbi:MAG: response regulator [Pseudomonadota bacterium]